MRHRHIRLLFGGFILAFIVLVPLDFHLSQSTTRTPSVHTTPIIARRLNWPVTPMTALTPKEACATRNVECARFMLNTLNRHRQAAGVPPYTLDWDLTHNAGSCQGATPHAIAMAVTDSIWHTNPSYPANSFPDDICIPWSAVGQNVGESGGNEADALASIDAMMMAEPHSPGCTGNHACNILSATYTRVGFGFARRDGLIFLVEDFIR